MRSQRKDGGDGYERDGQCSALTDASLLAQAVERRAQGLGLIHRAHTGRRLSSLVQVHPNVWRRHCLPGFQHLQRHCGQPVGRIGAFCAAVPISEVRAGILEYAHHFGAENRASISAPDPAGHSDERADENVVQTPGADDYLHAPLSVLGHRQRLVHRSAVH